MSIERKVGDQVWYAFFGLEEVRKICPICDGSKKVTLILGNSDNIILDCQYCSRGFEPPTGFITEYEYVAKADLKIITEIKSVEDSCGKKNEYISRSFDHHYYLDEDKMFDTKEKALQKAEELARIHQEEEFSRAERIKQDKNKSYSWNAGCHLRQAKDHKRQLEYHEKKAMVCKERSKENKDS